jgi:hypothetical protein
MMDQMFFNAMTPEQQANLRAIYGQDASIREIAGGQREVASDPLAQLYRRDWLDYLRDFAGPGGPEDQLIGSYRNLGDRREARGLALQDVNRGFDQAQAALGDRLGRYGLAMTPQQQAEQQRRSQFARGLAEVGAINNTSRRMDDRDVALMTTGVRAPALPGAT